MATTNKVVHEVAEQQYNYGWVTDIESDIIPPGLNEDVVRFISAKKNEPEFMLEWRLKAFRHFMTLVEDEQAPDWANIEFPKIDFQSISYYAAPKPKKELESLDEVDPELIKTYEKLVI